MKFEARELQETRDISQGITTWKDTLKNIVSVVLVLGFLYLAFGLIAEGIAHSLPDEWEAKVFGEPIIGHEGYIRQELMDADLKERYLNAQQSFSRLINSAQKRDLRDLPYTLIVLQTDEINAFAYPGGTIGVTSGLLKAVESEVGVAMVLAHELGHHQYRHTLRRMGRSLLFTCGIALITQGNVSGGLDQALSFAELAYSRSQELDADEYGFNLVLSTFGTSKGVLDLFEIMKHHEKEDLVGSWTAFSQTHPPTEDRIEKLKRYIKSISKD